MPVVNHHETSFYQEFLMARHRFEPQEFGVDMDRHQFDDRILDAFNARFRAQITIDELLLHPREALAFCDGVRQQQAWFDVPDDIILRVVMAHRKNP